MSWKEFLRPGKRKVLVFLLIVSILALRGMHWLVEEIDLIWVPLLLLSTAILVPVGILFWMGSKAVPVANDVVPFPSDWLLLIYPGLVLYSYLLACAVVHLMERQDGRATGQIN